MPPGKSAPLPALSSASLPGSLPGSLALSAVFAVLVATASCADAEGPAPGDRVRHVSDGDLVTIEVDGLWASDWSELPGMSLDTLIHPADGDQLGIVAPLHAAWLSDGRLLFADVGTSRIWVRSESGDWVQTVGPGPGPGELRMIGGAWARDAGFTVFERQTAELVHFDAEGRLVARDVVVADEARLQAMRGRSPWEPVVQYLGGDDWLVSVAGDREPGATAAAMGARWSFVRVTGSPAREEREIGAGAARTVVVEGGGGVFVPFVPNAVAAGSFGRPGDPPAAPGRPVAVFEADRPEVELLDETGSALLRVRWTDAPVPLGPTHRAVIGDFMRANMPGAIESSELDRMIEGWEALVPWPETLPPLGDLRLGTDGSIWIATPMRSGFELPNQPELIAEWRVIVPGPNAEATRVHRLRLPAGTTLLGPVADPQSVADPGSAGGGGFFVLLRDELGRQGLGILRH